MFSNLEADDDRRPDLLIRNPYGGGEQIVVDVTVLVAKLATLSSNAAFCFTVK
jgi:hypothetical protein